jgi:putative flippase GtrA
MRQLIRFVLVGVLVTIFNYLLFLILLSIGMVYWLAMVMGYMFGTALGYQINKEWTFQAKGSNVKILMYFILYLFSLLTGLTLIMALVEFYAMDPKIANLISIVVTANINFFGSKLGVFRNAYL